MFVFFPFSSWIQDNCIRSYTLHRDKLKDACKLKDFKQAVAEIEEYIAKREVGFRFKNSHSSLNLYVDVCCLFEVLKMNWNLNYFLLWLLVIKFIFGWLQSEGGSVSEPEPEEEAANESASNEVGSKKKVTSDKPRKVGLFICFFCVFINFLFLNKYVFLIRSYVIFSFVCLCL